MTAAEQAIESCPTGGIVALVHVGRGEQLAPLVRLARDRGVRILAVDRWRYALRWLAKNAPDTYGHFTLYVGPPEQAARDARPKSLDAVVYLSGEATEAEREAWKAALR
jgi:hypothetical protein